MRFGAYYRRIAIEKARSTRQYISRAIVPAEVFLFLFSAVTLFSTSTIAPGWAGSCDIQMASLKIPFRDLTKDSTRPGNVGIVPTGFVKPDKLGPVVNGIDVSKWQDDVDFLRARNCGAGFAYIRLSTGTNPDQELKYRDFWSNARSYLGNFVGGYHTLTLADTPKNYSALSSEDRAALSTKNVTSANTQAKLFKWRLREVLSYEESQPNSRYLGGPFLPIVLSATQRPQSKNRDIDQTGFGVTYGEAICAWIEEIHNEADFATQPVILFTTAYIYRDYGLERASCSLRTLPVWISQHNRDGGRPLSYTGDETKRAIMDLCKLSPTDDPAAVGRCIFQQYTSFGGFAAFQTKAELDLDRFYGNEQELGKLLQRVIHAESH